MSIIKKICAFFTIKGKHQQMELASAEVNQNGVYLQPKNDPEHTFFIDSNAIDIFINPGAELSEEDIVIFDNKKKEKSSKDGVKDGLSKETHSRIYPRSLSSFMPSKRRFSVLLYQDEYDSLMDEITGKGYKKVEYFLACMTSAKKQSMAAAYKRYTTEHAKRHRSDLNEARKAQEEDYISRKKEAEQIQEAAAL